ncbi:uncharacterized protein LOC18021632 isoform X2 [Eutrema salsugineum]|uniref:uncharacterized protein LOC18021632 isoform X2 n=1 Tax=Eutrema salsugineum TaxID=72664 RepID=UPI000CED00DB|nr:uncharacterized protein LOC18021632 isoform X2 [Eutrema salsugineum]
MVAPPFAAASSDIHPPCPAVSESTLSQLGIPNEFPYEFDSSAFSSVFNSSEDSTETQCETSDDEDDFLAGLTRRLALSTQRLSSPPSLVNDKPEVKPANSTLSGPVSCSNSGDRSPNGPFSQVPSPSTSPFREEEEDSLKVLSAAAGEVAKIKMANFVAKPISRPNPNPSSFVPFPQNAAFCDYYYWLWQPVLFASPYPVGGVLAAPTAVKQTSAGTGVFIPRNHPNPSDSRKKSGGGSVKFRSKVVHQQKPKIKEFSGRSQSSLQSTGSSKIAGGCLKEERHHLPQEWMY